MAASDGIEIIPAGPDRPHTHAAMLAQVFGPSEKFTAKAIAWRYRDNPAGAVVGADAWSGETLAAHYVTCPAQMTLEGRPARGLLSLNTATHPDFQGKGLFTRLAEATYSAGADQGFDFVFGVANANSTPGFIRKLGFQLVAPLAAGALVNPPRGFEPEPVQLAGAWDARTLSWRLANPAGRYQIARRGELTAVWARTHLPIVDCAAFLPQVAEAPDQGAPPRMSLFIGLDPRLGLDRRIFLPLPERLRPSPLNLIYRPLSARAPKALEAAQVAISFLDFDPY